MHRPGLRVRVAVAPPALRARLPAVAVAPPGAPSQLGPEPGGRARAPAPNRENLPRPPMESDAAGAPGKRLRAGQPGTPAPEETAAEALAAGPAVDEPGDGALRQLAAKRARYRVFAPSELVGVVPDWMFTKRYLEALSSPGAAEAAAGPGTQAAGTSANGPEAGPGEQKVDPGYDLVDLSDHPRAVVVDLGADEGGGDPAAGDDSDNNPEVYKDESQPRSRVPPLTPPKRFRAGAFGRG